MSNRDKPDDLWSQIDNFEAHDDLLDLEPQAPETPGDIGAVSTLGTGGKSHSDHAHRGVGSVTIDSEVLYGGLTFTEGSGISIEVDSDTGEVTFAVDDPLVIGAISVEDLFVDEIFPNSVSPGPGITVWSTLIIQEELRVDVITAASESPDGYVEFLSPVIVPVRITNIDDGDSPYTILDSDQVIHADTDGGNIVTNLPAIVQGTRYRIVNTGTSSNTVSIAPNGAENLLGENSSFMLCDQEALDTNGDTAQGWE